MGHKRILGKTTDFITGREITDTDDERYRQKLAHFLVEKKAYAKEDIEVRRRLEMAIDGKKVFSMVDFVMRINDTVVIVIRYGPGSIVTRERPALATARILEPYVVPFTVVTNGEDAEMLDTVTGKVIGTGLDAIPDKHSASDNLKNITLQTLAENQIETEKRILSAYDYLEHSLECDDDWWAVD